MQTPLGDVWLLRRLSHWQTLARLAAASALVLMALASDVAVGSAGSTAAAGPTVMIVSMSSTCSSPFCYQPNKISIKTGTTVTWVNTTGASHTVTRCTPAACSGVGGGTGKDTGFGSSVISPGSSYTFTFDGKGTYIYYCAIHGYAVMHGKVVEVT